MRRSRFDPREATNTFIVATADYVTFLSAPAVTAILHQEAPHACVRFIDIPLDYRAALGRGDLDLVIVSQGPTQDLAPWTASTPFLKDDMVVIVSRRKRAFKGRLTRRIYEESPHAALQLQARSPTDHEAMTLNALGIKQANRVTVQQFLTLPVIVQNTACLALVQRRLADAFCRTYDIEILQPPFNMPQLELTAHWRRSTDADPASIWFRDVLRRAPLANLDASPFDKNAWLIVTERLAPVTASNKIFYVGDH